MLVTRHHSGERLQVNIIAMGLKFNRLVLSIGTPITLWSAASMAQQTLPLIIPEAEFRALPRITGNTLNQRMMDAYSIIRVQFSDTSQTLAPDTPVTVFRQGLRLRALDGQALGVLAIPVAQGSALSATALERDVANPSQKGVGWLRLKSMRQEVIRGDSVMTQGELATHQPVSCPPTPRRSLPSAPRAEVIALASQTDIMSGSGDLVVVSGGCALGLNKGNEVSFWRPAGVTYGRRLDQPVEAPVNDGNSVFEDNPDIAKEASSSHRVGQGTVVASYPSATIVRIRGISQAVQSGDIVRPTVNSQQPAHESRPNNK